MSVRSIEASTLALQQINDSNGNPAITISPTGVVAVVSDAQDTSSDSNAISTIAYVNNSIAAASVALSPSGSYRWTGTYNIFQNPSLGFGGSGLPTTIPANGTSTATGMMLAANTGGLLETNFYNFSNTGIGGFNFYNLSATSPLANFASLGPNEGIPVFNLKGTGGQFQINGVNILNNVITTTTLANYALINSPTFTGVPKAPTALSGNNSTQLATTAFVQSALASTGSFSPNTPYTWGSSYQLFGNDQVVCVGSSLMNTNKPQTGATSPNQGSQICNNTQLQGETDFVNYSGASQGGFCFQQMSSTNALATLGTLYRSGAASILNLPNASSQFQINGTSIARQTTSTLVNTRVPQTITFTVSGSSATYTSNIVTATYISTNTINGVNSVYVGWQTGGITPLTAPLEISSTVFTGSTFTTIVPIAQLNGPVPTNYQNISFTINMYLGTSGNIGNPILGYGGITRDTNNNYWVVFASFSNIYTTSAICFSSFAFTYQ
jgi:hypothetical protein